MVKHDSRTAAAFIVTSITSGDGIARAGHNSGNKKPAGGGFRKRPCRDGPLARFKQELSALRRLSGSSIPITDNTILQDTACQSLDAFIELSDTPHIFFVAPIWESSAQNRAGNRKEMMKKSMSTDAHIVFNYCRNRRSCWKTGASGHCSVVDIRHCSKSPLRSTVVSSPRSP